MGSDLGTIGELEDGSMLDLLWWSDVDGVDTFSCVWVCLRFFFDPRVVLSSSANAAAWSGSEKY